MEFGSGSGAPDGVNAGTSAGADGRTIQQGSPVSRERAQGCCGGGTKGIEAMSCVRTTNVDLTKKIKNTHWMWSLSSSWRLVLLLLCSLNWGALALDSCSITNGATANTADCSCGTSDCTSTSGFFCQSNTCHTSAFGSAALPDGDGGHGTPGGGLRKVVSHWIGGGDLKKTVITTYGSIEDWQVSGVTSLRYVFYIKPTFNADLSKWNVAAVTTMKQSTYNSTSFFVFLVLFNSTTL